MFACCCFGFFLYLFFAFFPFILFSQWFPKSWTTYAPKCRWSGDRKWTDGRISVWNCVGGTGPFTQTGWDSVTLGPRLSVTLRLKDLSVKIIQMLFSFFFSFFRSLVVLFFCLAPPSGDLVWYIIWFLSINSFPSRLFEKKPIPQLMIFKKIRKSCKWCHVVFCH